MSNFWAIVIGAALAIGGGSGVVAWHNHHKPPALADSFNRPAYRMAEDLQGRYVSLPTGQLWGFNPDQKVDVKTLQAKSADEGVVVVAVHLSSLAKVQVAVQGPPAPSMKPEAAITPGKPGTMPTSPPGANEKQESVSVLLDGIAKMHYELIAGEWHLTDVTSVTLKATQR